MTDTNPNTARPSPRQRQAITLILEGRSDFDISNQIGIDRKTLYNWRSKDDDFRKALDDARDAATQDQADRLRMILDHALNALAQQIHDPYAPTSHRAARTVLYASRLGHLLVPPASATHSP